MTAPFLFVVGMIILSMFVLWLMAKLDNRLNRRARLHNHSVMEECDCGRIVTRRQMISDHNQCVYCLLESHDLSDEFRAYSEQTSKVVIATPKPKED
jgi:hypothetical protein